MHDSVTPVPRPRPARLISPARAEATVPPPLDGPWAATDSSLDGVEVFPLPAGVGPEDVAIDAAGRVVTGADDGRVWRLDGGVFEVVADTGGRPLGIELDPRDGSLVVCDAYRGLLRIVPDGPAGGVGGAGRGTVVELATHVAGTKIGVCNNAAVAADGTVYFSDSSTRYPLSGWKRDILEHRPNGRLLRYDPASGDVDVVLDELYFPNGVALTPDETAVMLVETTTHRLIRVPLDGSAPRVLADLAAYPDNMSPVGDGTYWIALPSPRLPIVEKLLPHPGVRRMVALLPEGVQPRPARYGLVALVDGEGAVLRTLHGPTGRYCMITGVRQHGGDLWFGSLTEGGVARVAL